MKVDFDYAVGAPVMLKELGRPGIVRGLNFDGKQRTYQTTYWHEGQRRSEWLPADELEPR